MMNVRRMTLLLGVIVSATVAVAQNTSKEINDVKRDGSYVYAESTDKDAEQAFEMARVQLIAYMGEYAQEQRELSDDDREQIKKNANKLQRMQMARGEQTRVFVYIRKSDILPSQASSPSPAQTQPAVQPKGQSQASAQPLPTPQAAPVQVQAGTWQEQVVQDLLQCETLAQGKAMLNRLKVEYRVKRTGYMSTCGDKSVCYFLLGDAAGNVVTVLGPGEGARTNYRTREADALENYETENAIWFQLAK